MPSVIRNASIYVNGKKLGTATQATYTWNSGNENQVGDGKWLGVSQGVPTSSLSCTEIIPVGGADGQATLEDALKNYQYLQIAIGVIGTKIHKIDMAVMTAEYDTTMANGTLTGKFDLIGGDPEMA